MWQLDWALSQMPGFEIFAAPSFGQPLHMCLCTAESMSFLLGPPVVVPPAPAWVVLDTRSGQNGDTR